MAFIGPRRYPQPVIVIPGSSDEDSPEPVDKNADVNATGDRLKSLELGNSPESPSDARNAIRQAIASSSGTDGYPAEPPRKRARTESPPHSTPSKGKAVRFDTHEEDLEQKQQQRQQKRREKRKRYKQKQKQQKQQQQQTGSHGTPSQALDETDPALIPTPSPERGPPKSFSPFTPRNKRMHAKPAGSSNTPTEASNMQHATSSAPTTTETSNMQRTTSSTVAASTTGSNNDAANNSTGDDNNKDATENTEAPTPERPSTDPQAPADPRPPVQPHELVERALNHLNNLRAQLASDEHVASAREDRLMQLLSQARQLRVATAQWRRDGMVVIRDRERVSPPPRVPSLAVHIDTDTRPEHPAHAQHDSARDRRGPGLGRAAEAAHARR